MKKTYIIFGLILLLSGISGAAYAQNKDLAIMGDSRGWQLWFGSAAIVAQLEQGEVSNVKLESGPGMWAFALRDAMKRRADYHNHSTVISIGGNDVLLYYSAVMPLKRYALGETGMWDRLDPYYDLKRIIAAYYWFWAIDLCLNQTHLNVYYTVQDILLKHGNNKVILNDIAPLKIWFFPPIVPGYNNEDFDVWDVNFINMMLINLGDRYHAGISDLASRFPDRVSFLQTFPVFYFNPNYYLGTKIGNFGNDGIHFSAEGVAVWGTMIGYRLAELGWYNSNAANTSKIVDCSFYDDGSAISVELEYDTPIEVSELNSANLFVFADHHYPVNKTNTYVCDQVYHPAEANSNAALCCLLCAYFGQGGECCLACNVAYPPAPAWTEDIYCTATKDWDDNEIFKIPYKESKNGNTVLVFESNTTLTDPLSPTPAWNYVNINTTVGGANDYPVYDIYGRKAQKPNITEYPVE